LYVAYKTKQKNKKNKFSDKFTTITVKKDKEIIYDRMHWIFIKTIPSSEKR